MSNDTPAMGDGIQNAETGEIEYFLPEEPETTTQRIRVDVDAETGEPECTKLPVRYRKRKPFRIPKKYLKNDSDEDDLDEPSCSKKKIAPYNPFDKEALIKMDCVNKDIVLGFTKSSYLLFLIPSVFCFTKMTAILILACESFLHYLAHYKNRKNTNNDIFYRSPLHLLTSQFCVQCRADNEMDSIRRLHKKSMLNLNINFKDMTKVIG